MCRLGMECLVISIKGRTALFWGVNLLLYIKDINFECECRFAAISMRSPKQSMISLFQHTYSATTVLLRMPSTGHHDCYDCPRGFGGRKVLAAQSSRQNVSSPNLSRKRER
jgi:hypothetical protein